MNLGTVVIIAPDKHPLVVRDHGLELADLQRVVGGYIETALRAPSSHGRHIDVYCDEEGLLKADPILCCYRVTDGAPLVGTLIVVASSRQGATVGLTDNEVARIALTPNRTLIIRPL